jgi:hypothetical protein
MTRHADDATFANDTGREEGRARNRQGQANGHDSARRHSRGG